MAGPTSLGLADTLIGRECARGATCHWRGADLTELGLMASQEPDLASLATG